MTQWVDQLKDNSIPDYAKDTRLNIDAVIKRSALPQEEAEAVAVAAAFATGESGDKLFVEKFAELIVRKCINIACNYDKPKLSGPGLAIACNIESHFDIYIEEDGRFVK